MVRTAIQLYTLRDVDLSLPALLERVGETDFDGVEFAHRAEDADPSEIRAVLDETGLDVAGAHVGMDQLESDLEATVDHYRTLGCETLIVPYLHDPHFETREAVAETASRLSALAEELAEHGIALRYHNHDHEFVDFDDENQLVSDVGDGSAVVDNAFEAFLEESDGVGVELDAGWAAAAGHDPVALIEHYGDRIPMVHVADVTADGEPAEVGEGVTDLEGCAAAAIDAGAEWLIYEHDKPDDPLASLDHGASFCSALRARTNE